MAPRNQHMMQTGASEHRELRMQAYEDPKTTQNNGSASAVPLLQVAVDASSPQKLSPANEELDIVQFSSAMYFVEADEAVLTVDVMRIGNLVGPVSVRYFTEDSSGKAGNQYIASSGTIVFQDGQHENSFDIPILDDPGWNPTLEFKIHLDDPTGCELGLYLKLTRVKVMDKTPFPSYAFRDAISEAMVKGEEAIDRIDNIQLLKEFFKLMMLKDGMTWRTSLTVACDQIRNLYLFLTLSLNIYVVDVVFNFADKDSAKELIFRKGDREGEAVVVACFTIFPMAIIHIWEWAKVEIDTTGLIIEYLQANAFRKYLNFSEESRQKVPPVDMFNIIANDTRQVAKSFTMMLDFLRILGKVSILTYFTLTQNPGSLWAIITMGLLMIIFAWLRRTTTARAAKAAQGPESRFHDYVTEICDKYELVADYFQRPPTNEKFARLGSECRSAEMPLKKVLLNNEYFTKWLGPTYIGLYTALAAKQVLDGSLSLGTFLATLSIFSSISSEFSELFALQEQIKISMTPLKDLTYVINLPTDVPSWKKVNRHRRANTKAARASFSSSRASEIEGNPARSSVSLNCPLDDDLRMELKDVSFRYREGGDYVLRNINLTCEQGKIVSLIGPQGSGRNTFCRLLAHKLFPESGSISFPSHLRILHVSHPLFFLNAGLWDNLILGRGKHADPKRVADIIKSLKMAHAEPLCLKEVQQQINEQTQANATGGDEDEEGPKENGDKEEIKEQDNPITYLNFTEKAKLHLARALIMNPEVMVMQRPFSHHNDEEDRRLIWDLLSQHVRYRGLGLPFETVHRRRPRTVFFSAETEQQANQADLIWRLMPDSDNSHTIRTEASRKFKDGRVPITSQPSKDQIIQTATATLEVAAEAGTRVLQTGITDGWRTGIEVQITDGKKSETNEISGFVQNAYLARPLMYSYPAVSKVTVLGEATPRSDVLMEAAQPTAMNGRPAVNEIAPAKIEEEGIIDITDPLQARAILERERLLVQEQRQIAERERQRGLMMQRQGLLWQMRTM